jgi:endonuclease G
MARRSAERLKSYLELITRKQGLESVIESTSPSGGLESTAESTESAAARSGLESVRKGQEPTPDEQASLEALIIPKLRPAIDIVDGKFNVTHELWTHLSTDPAIRGRIEAAIPSIGRLELPGNSQYPYGGTGFVVGDGLLMTNRHVAAIFANGLGNRNLTFKSGLKAGIDFDRERGRPPGTTLMVQRVVMIHPYWDMAILAVEGLPANRKPLKLSLADISDFDGREIAVIGYPAFDPRNDQAEQDKLFDSEYGVKRLQPGQLHGRADTESFGKVVSAAAHDCSTLGGNSGSEVVDLATGEIVALHFGGRYQDKNFGVPAFELARDRRVIDAGVNFAGTPTGGVPPWSDWWERADMTEAAEGQATTSPSAPVTAAASAIRPVTGATSAIRLTTDGGVNVEIPLHITVRIGSPTAAVSGTEGVAATDGEILEAMVEPWRDTHYDSRKGYDESFLDVNIPLPSAADANVLAQTLNGNTILRYEHFSVQMHAGRRLALVTASNVTADPKLKKPEKGQDYTRKGLTGLGPHDQEKWFIDPRLDEKFQLPDTFFTKDRQAFDKGHIVRRDDVAWGKNYAELRRANGDSYHVTNCSPQTAQFNRSTEGVENWGDLENHVLSSASKENLSLFAGPVLDVSDTIFVGTGGGGREIRAKIPSRFWKVVIASIQDGIAAFGFVLEQDLSDVQFEYVVSDEFMPHMYPLADIEQMTGVKFPSIVLDADQYDTVRGAEVAISAGAPRKRRSKGS